MEQKKETIHLLVNVFNKSNTRSGDATVIFDVHNKSYNNILIEVYEIFTKYLKFKKDIDYGSCRILWMRESERNAQWVEYEGSYIATSTDYYTEIYTYSKETAKIVRNKDV